MRRIKFRLKAFRRQLKDLLAGKCKYAARRLGPICPLLGRLCRPLVRPPLGRQRQRRRQRLWRQRPQRRRRGAAYGAERRGGRGAVVECGDRHSTATTSVELALAAPSLAAAVGWVRADCAPPSCRRQCEAGRLRRLQSPFVDSRVFLLRPNLRLGYRLPTPILTPISHLV